MSFQIEWHRNDVYVRFYGDLTLQDFRQVNGLIYGDMRFDDMIYQIADFIDVLSISLTVDEVKVVSTLEVSATRWNESVKVAHVSTNILLQNLIKAYEKGMQGTNWSCRLFENLDDAKTWCRE